MKDIRILSAKVVLNVAQMFPLRDFLPPSIVLIGDQLDKATEIIYNDMPVDEFFAQSPTRLIVKIPASAVGKPFISVKVLSTTQVSKKDAEITTKLNTPLQTLSGIDRLVQAWITTFMTTPGSDVFDKSSGGGGQKLVGKMTDKDGRGISADLTMAIDRTRIEIMKKQSSSNKIPSNEKLLNCELGQVVFDPYTGKLMARVFLRNMVGDSAEVSLGQ